MVHDLSDLSRAFLVNKPEAAARALEALTPEDAAAFLSTCPADVVGPVMTALQNEQAAHLLALMSDEKASGILKVLAPNEIAFILRAARSAHRDSLISLLPKRLSTRATQLLAYPRDLIGAWSRSDFLTLSPDLTVGQAHDRAQATPYSLDDPIFLVGPGRIYAGAVRVSELVRARPTRKLRSLTISDLPPLYDRTTIAAVADLTLWAIHNRVPVIDRRNRFVGVLTESVLRQALGEAPSDETVLAGTTTGPVVQLTASYTRFLAGALHIILGRPPTRP